MSIRTETAADRVRAIPGPQGVPLLGVLPQARKNLLAFFLNAAIEYGDLVRLDMGPASIVLISNPEHVKYILQDNQKSFNKGYELVKPVLGKGLVSAEGEHWFRQRRLIQPIFNRPQLVKFTETMIDKTRDMIERWRSRPNQDEPLDVANEMMRLTQTIIVSTMFSTDVSAEAPNIAEAFATSLEYMNSLIMRPVAFIDRLPTPTNRRFHRAITYLDGVIYKLIDDRRKSGEDKGDFLSLLINARDATGEEGMDDQQIRDEVMTIFLAGHETTATLLAWTWYLLSKNPGVDRRMRAEINGLLNGREPTAADLPSLEYTRMVLDESLRLYPPAWMFARQPVEDVEIGGYSIPAGTTITLSPYVTQHHPAYWRNPEGFDPDRFCPENVGERPKFAYFPFGGGPRQCIGNNFAIMEAQIIATMIVQAFNLELAPGYTVTPTPIATLRPKPGVFMRLRPL